MVDVEAAVTGAAEAWVEVVGAVGVGETLVTGVVVGWTPGVASEVGVGDSATNF